MSLTVTILRIFWFYTTIGLETQREIGRLRKALSCDRVSLDIIGGQKHSDHRPLKESSPEIDRVRSLGVDSLRTLWRTTFRSSPPPAFSKDILARFLCWHIQEQAFTPAETRPVCA